MLRALMTDTLLCVLRMRIGACPHVIDGPFLCLLGLITSAVSLGSGVWSVSLIGLGVLVFGLLRIWSGMVLLAGAAPRKVRVLLLASTITVGSLDAAAQEIDVDDLKSTVDSAMEREMSDAQRFADEALALADKRTDEAAGVGETLDRIHEETIGVFETFNAPTNGFDGLLDNSSDDPSVFVFVSLGMPDDALRGYISEARSIGASVLIRGFYGGSITNTQVRISELFEEGDEGGVGIDPRAFEAFNIEYVPAIVVSHGTVEPCGAIDCLPVAPPHDIVRGNITIRAALDLIETRR